MAYVIKKGATKARRFRALDAKGAPMPIHQATALRWRGRLRTGPNTWDPALKWDVVVNAEVPLDPLNKSQWGWYTWNPLVGHVDLAGTFDAEVRVTWPDGSVDVVPSGDDDQRYFEIIVREDLAL